MNLMRRAVLLGLAAALPSSAFALDGEAMRSLRDAAGDDAPVTAAPAAARKVAYRSEPPEWDSDEAPRPPLAIPARPVPTIACRMSMRLTERTGQLIFLRLFKNIDGTAVITCTDGRRVPLRVHGGGLALGLGIPNESPFSSVNGVIAGNIEIRLPTAFIPKQLEGSYTNVGFLNGLGYDGTLSPWTNSDGSLGATIYLPTDLNLSVGILTITELEFWLI